MFFLISQSPEEMKITWVIDIELLVHSFTSFFIIKKMKYSPFCNSLPFSSVSVQCTLYTGKRQGIMERPLDKRFKKQLKCNGAFDQKYNYIVLTG